MAVLEIARIQVRRGQENQTGVPQLEPGEFGWAQDTENLYIGKRITEGGVDNLNTRVLTENDLSNIFKLVSGTSTQVISYQYREPVAHIQYAVDRSLQSKLDDTVNLADFGVVPSFTATDITVEFRRAITDLFNNSTWDSPERYDSRRKLLLPEGNYTISDVIDLPPYTSIMGQGPELTRLTLITGDSSMFRTVDAEGNIYETENMSSGFKRAREVSIQGLTLEYDYLNTSSQHSLISLDNVLNANISDCVFRTAINSVTTTTYGLVNYGVGIEIRGQGGGIGSGDVNLCENVHIENCQFDALYRGIQSTGTVIKPVISNSKFSNLNQGIALYAVGALPGPSNAHITESRFENIVRQAIYVGPNTDSTYRSNHISSYNFFIQVGNGVGLDDYTVDEQYPILEFLAQGNKSVNDYFHRRQLANNVTEGTFYYNPLVVGSTTINDGATTTATIASSSTNIINRIGVTGVAQQVNMRYQISNQALSRTGNLLINIAPDGYTSLTDNFNFSQGLYEIATAITTATGSDVNLFNVDTALYPIFSTIAPTVGMIDYYLTGNNVYQNKVAKLAFNIGTTGTIALFVTESLDPAFNFSTSNEEYTLLQDHNPIIEFSIEDSLASVNNYVILKCSNNSNFVDFSLSYQIDILS